MLEEVSKDLLHKINGFDNHELVVHFSDEPTGLEGFVAIHNTSLGPAVGGTRMHAFVTQEEALADALKLSRAMTYKCALAGVPYGGGKCVIMGDPRQKTPAFLAAYGRVIEELGGKIRTGVDAGIEDADVSAMAKETKYMIGAFDAAVEKLSTGDMAALGVFYSLETCLNFLFGQGSLQNRTIAIQGLGKLGAELLRLLYAQGAKIVASDASLDRLEQLHKQYPKIKMVAPSLIHKQVCDVYAPCALGGELNLVTVSELKTKIVCGGSNNQLASSDLAKDLYKRGILYAPDYIVNSGGLINVVDEMEPDGYKKERVLKRVKGIAHTLADILNQAKAENLMPLVVADRLAGSIIYNHTLKKINGQAQNYGTAAAQ